MMQVSLIVHFGLLKRGQTATEIVEEIMSEATKYAMKIERDHLVSLQIIG